MVTHLCIPAVVQAVAAAHIAPQEQGEVEKPSGAIRASSCCLYPLMAPSDQDQCWAPATGVSSGSSAGCRCEQDQHWQWVRAAALTLAAGVSIRLTLGFMSSTAFLSMWLSNTSTAAMVMPIVEAVVQQIISAEAQVKATQMANCNGSINHGLEMEECVNEDETNETKEKTKPVPGFKEMFKGGKTKTVEQKAYADVIKQEYKKLGRIRINLTIGKRRNKSLLHDEPLVLNADDLQSAQLGLGGKLATQAEAIHVNPLYILIPSTLCTSFAFLLPVANPSNAIVFSYGHLKITDMVKAGLGVNILGVAVVMLGTFTWMVPMFDLHTYPPWATIVNNGTMP
ncbi:Solute carrier family 13 member 1 [Myotis brandtii]|uniref:Solute carrier family 13 member 1 n=1 Tax=Myotis brandtii TaxID=109478 RepID=S7PX53_MYOBR|nr:Solute carrier family 13 member 1 [Myotis brandtii]